MELSQSIEYKAARPGTDLFDQVQRLRYQVYCVERGFLDAGQYPQRRESDEFDAHSMHFCEVDDAKAVTGAVRLVFRSPLGYPLFRYCTVYPEDIQLLHAPEARIAEISRLVVSRECRERARGDTVLRLYREMYQASKRMGVTHVIAAIEKSLARLLSRYRLPLRQIGPEAEFAGRVTPYVIHVAQFDRIIASGECPSLDTFLDGLEIEYRPAMCAA